MTIDPADVEAIARTARPAPAGPYGRVWREATDEIERLRSENARLRDQLAAGPDPRVRARDVLTGAGLAHVLDDTPDNQHDQGDRHEQ